MFVSLFLSPADDVSTPTIHLYRLPEDFKTCQAADMAHMSRQPVCVMVRLLQRHMPYAQFIFTLFYFCLSIVPLHSMMFYYVPHCSM